MFHSYAPSISPPVLYIKMPTEQKYEVQKEISLGKRSFCRVVMILILDVGNLISGSFAFSKTSLNIWKFMVYVLLKPGLENFEHYFTSE